mgnify:CR=1 FL=1
MGNEQKTMHWLAIHKKVWTAVFSDMPIYLRTYIAADQDHVTRSHKEFSDFVLSETNRCYEDPDWYFNDKYSFLPQ